MLIVRPEGGVRPVPHLLFTFLLRRFARNVLCLMDRFTQESLEHHNVPQTLHESVDPLRAHPTSFSIAGVLGEDSYQRVACHLP